MREVLATVVAASSYMRRDGYGGASVQRGTSAAANHSPAERAEPARYPWRPVLVLTGLASARRVALAHARSQVCTTILG